MVGRWKWKIPATIGFAGLAMLAFAQNQNRVNGGASGVPKGVEAGSILGSRNAHNTPVYQAKPVLDVRDISGVDCTGATDSSTALNALTGTSNAVSNKTLSFRGCPMVQLQHQWLIFGQEQFEVDLGNTINATGASGNNTNAVLFGCAGAAGALVQVSRSGYVSIHGGSIVASGGGWCPGGTPSSFTGSLLFTNNASGGYTTTNAHLRDVFLTSNTGGGKITGYFGVELGAGQNMEEMNFSNVHINGQNSPGSYCFWSIDGNADSTTIEGNSAIGGCYQGIRMEQGRVRVYNSDIGNNGGYSIYGAGGAAIYEGNGCVTTLIESIMAEGSGPILNMGDDGSTYSTACGYARFWADNQLSANDISSTTYPINLRGGSLTLSGNNFSTEMSSIHNNVWIGTDSTSLPKGVTVTDLGGNILPSNVNALYEAPMTSSASGNGYSTNSFYGGTQSQTYYPSSFSTNTYHDSPSPTLSLNGFSTNIQHGFTMGMTSNSGNGGGVGVGATLSYVYNPGALTTAAGVIAVQPPFSGLQTEGIASPPILLAVSPRGTAGTTSYTYKVVARAGYGNTAASNSETITTGNATLSGTITNGIAYGNCNSLPVNDAPHETGMGAWGYDLYRTASGGTPSSTGYIGTISGMTGAHAAGVFGVGAQYVFFDCGAAGNSATPPASSTANGSISIPSGASFVGGAVKVSTYNTATNCAAAGTAANPSVASCGAAAAGAFACSTSASTGTCQVNSTAVTANSRIFVQPSTAEGTSLSVTCNPLADTGLTAPRLLSKSAGSGFAINLGTFSTNPMCFDYWIVN